MSRVVSGVDLVNDGGCGMCWLYILNVDVSKYYSQDSRSFHVRKSRIMRGGILGFGSDGG